MSIFLVCLSSSFLVFSMASSRNSLCLITLVTSASALALSTVRFSTCLIRSEFFNLVSFSSFLAFAASIPPFIAFTFSRSSLCFFMIFACLSSCTFSLSLVSLSMLTVPWRTAFFSFSALYLSSISSSLVYGSSSSVSLGFSTSTTVSSLSSSILLSYSSSNLSMLSMSA